MLRLKLLFKIAMTDFMPNEPKLLIRAEQDTDIKAIEQLTITAFQSAEHTSHTEHLIVNALRQADQLTVSLVAELSPQRIVGHVAISPVTLSNNENGWYGLAPVSVLPQMQGQGIGKTLVNTALEQLRMLGAKGCVVLGDPNYYQQFGFIAHPELSVAGVPAEFFQALSFSGEIPTATVQYHDAFNVTDSSI